MPTDFNAALEIASALLRTQEHPAGDDIREQVRKALRLLPAIADREDELVRTLETRFNVWVGTGTELFDNSDHQAWLPQRRSGIDWDYWNRYAAFLAGDKGWPTRVINSLQERVDTVLGFLEDPKRDGAWDRRGLVVGNVQSGKTSNYTGLICKAVDAGYQLIVVLAGVHNSLRSQTQLRLDEGFLGHDSVQLQLGLGGSRTPIGVARFDNSCQVPDTVTNRSDTGDFRRAFAKQFIITPSSRPLLFVVKKNVTILKNLLNWVLWSAPRPDDEQGRRVVPDIPLLVIDDEADYASIDTKKLPIDEDGQLLKDHDPTRTNARIRELLRSFEKSAYVGYTATPFANVYIHEEAFADGYGPDLFPRAFIVNLPTPSNYIGPARVFGLAADPDTGSEAQPELPVVRRVRDFQDWIPNKHNKYLVPGVLPASLREALRAFVLTCAARKARGQENAHNSMLVHVTRFTAVQEQVGQQIEEEVKNLTLRLKHGDGHSSSQLVEELRELWENDFVSTTRSINADDCPEVAWAEVASNLYAAASRIEVKLINGSAKDVLDYAEQAAGGLNVIAVGGDKLSRGLTLEGLSVSYYLRATRMYDTLMQMGRWFGYRPGYLDLCRLYTSWELAEWYSHITEADEELRQLFDAMASVRGTPEDFGIRVRSHPDMLVTGQVKMRNSYPLNLSYRGDISETIFFHRDEEAVKRHYEAVTRFLEILGDPTGRRGLSRPTLVWNDVPADTVVDDFLLRVSVHPKARKVVPELMAKYIRICNDADELRRWTVALVSSSDGTVCDIAGQTVGLICRRHHPATGPTPEEVGYYRVRRLVSPTDEHIDLTDAQLRAALEQSQRAGGGEPLRRPSGLAIRAVRPKTNGLMLLYPLEPKFVEGDCPVMGFAISFPDSDSIHTVNYVVNNVYFKQEYGDE